jgi:hypothetical protein
MVLTTFGTVIDVCDPSEIEACQQYLQNCKNKNDVISSIIRLHQYCNLEKTGLEYMLLLLLRPLSIAGKHMIPPRRLLRNMLKCVSENLFEGNGFVKEFTDNLSLYVQAKSEMREYGQGLHLPEPDPDYSVDILRVFLQTNAEYSAVVTEVMNVMSKLNLINSPVKVVISQSDDKQTIVFAVYLFSTSFTHHKVTSAIRSYARKNIKDSEMATSITRMQGQWDGLFDEEQKAPSLAQEKFMTPVSYVYDNSKLQENSFIHPIACYTGEISSILTV